MRTNSLNENQKFKKYRKIVMTRRRLKEQGFSDFILRQKFYPSYKQYVPFQNKYFDSKAEDTSFKVLSG